MLCCQFSFLVLFWGNLYYISRGMQQHEALFMVTVWPSADLDFRLPRLRGLSGLTTLRCTWAPTSLPIARDVDFFLLTWLLPFLGCSVFLTCRLKPPIFFYQVPTEELNPVVCKIKTPNSLCWTKKRTNNKTVHGFQSQSAGTSPVFHSFSVARSLCHCGLGRNGWCTLVEVSRLYLLHPDDDGRMPQWCADHVEVMSKVSIPKDITHYNNL